MLEFVHSGAVYAFLQNIEMVIHSKVTPFGIVRFPFITYFPVGTYKVPPPKSPSLLSNFWKILVLSVTPSLTAGRTNNAIVSARNSALNVDFIASHPHKI